MLANCENITQEHGFLASKPYSEMFPSLIQLHAFRKGNCFVDMSQADCFLFWKSLCSVNQRWDGSIHRVQGELASSVRMTSKYSWRIEAQVVRLSRYLNIKHPGDFFPMNWNCLFLYAVIFLLVSYFVSLFQKNLEFEFKFPFMLSVLWNPFW